MASGNDLNASVFFQSRRKEDVDARIRKAPVNSAAEKIEARERAIKEVVTDQKGIVTYIAFSQKIVFAHVRVETYFYCVLHATFRSSTTARWRRSADYSPRIA